MILDKWKADAEKIAARLPNDSSAAVRANYLLEDVTSRGIEVEPAYFNRSANSSHSPEKTFLVVDKNRLKTSSTQLGRMANRLLGVAFVADGPSVPSVLALPTYDPDTPAGNGIILLHELEHITEREAGILGASVGKRERRAYGQNALLLAAMDGSDFTSYIDRWPVTFTTTGPAALALSSSVSFHDTDCPTPPKETLLYDIWQEGGTSRRVLQSIGRTAVLEKVTSGLPQTHVDQLATNLQMSS